MFKIAIGSSAEIDTAQAVGDVIAQALCGLEGADAQAGILFNHGHSADNTLLSAVSDTWPQLQFTGCAGGGPDSSRKLRLLLLSSPDLEFHLSKPPATTESADLAAEHTLADFMPQAQRLALYLQLSDAGDAWQRSFDHSLRRLLPEHCRDLADLLPPSDMPDSPQRYYLGRRFVSAPAPLLLASYRQDNANGWQLTRQPGILRKQQNDTVWIYDTLLGDRRRKPAA